MNAIHLAVPTSVVFARCAKTDRGHVLTLALRPDCAITTKIDSIPQLSDLHTDALDAMILVENGTILRFGLVRDISVQDVLKASLRAEITQYEKQSTTSPTVKTPKPIKEKTPKPPKEAKAPKEPKQPKEAKEKRERVFSRKLVPHVAAILHARLKDGRAITNIAQEYKVAPIDIRLLLKENSIEGKTP